MEKIVKVHSVDIYAEGTDGVITLHPSEDDEPTGYVLEWDSKGNATLVLPADN